MKIFCDVFHIRTRLHKRIQVSFRQILLHTALKIFAIRKYACKFLPCLQKNLLENPHIFPMNTSSKTKRTVENIPPECFQNCSTANGTQGRSGLVRSALEKLSLFSPTFSVRQKHGAGNFAVCGQRLRGHVPSKNTSPAALSWSSLTCSTAPVLFVSARCFFCLRVILQHVM